MVAVVQLVEHQVVILDVAGSSPVSHPTGERTFGPPSGRRTLPIYLLHQPLIGAVYSIDVIRSLPSSPCVVAGVLLCTWAVVVMAAIAVWRVSSVVPGLFVAPWYGAGNATMSRSESRSSTSPCGGSSSPRTRWGHGIRRWRCPLSIVPTGCSSRPGPRCPTASTPRCW